MIDEPLSSSAFCTQKHIKNGLGHITKIAAIPTALRSTGGLDDLYYAFSEYFPYPFSAFISGNGHISQPLKLKNSKSCGIIWNKACPYHVLQKA